MSKYGIRQGTLDNRGAIPKSIVQQVFLHAELLARQWQYYQIGNKTLPKILAGAGGIGAPDWSSSWVQRPDQERPPGRFRCPFCYL
jgi:hypothetical protein